LRLRDIEQHAAGFDLALARIARRPSLGLVIPPYQYPPAVEVFAYGYPFTQSNWEPGDGFPTFDLQPRYLEGYVTRDFQYEQPGFGRTPTYELDMPAPEGLSGAPLIKRHSGELIGVVYGAADSYAIAETASLDQTGEPRPEIQRLVRFALAHSTRTVRSLAGTATNGRPLADVVNKA
jgi:hypothetical protein